MLIFIERIRIQKVDLISDRYGLSVHIQSNYRFIGISVKSHIGAPLVFDPKPDRHIHTCTNTHRYRQTDTKTQIKTHIPDTDTYTHVLTHIDTDRQTLRHR